MATLWLLDDIEQIVAGMDFEQLEKDLTKMCEPFKKQEEMLMMVAEQKYNELMKAKEVEK